MKSLVKTNVNTSLSSLTLKIRRKSGSTSIKKNAVTYINEDAAADWAWHYAN
ncbi:MAG: hypothetical protein ABI772_02310 [Bacteroidota bacterium]